MTHAPQDGASLPPLSLIDIVPRDPCDVTGCADLASAHVAEPTGLGPLLCRSHAEARRVRAAGLAAVEAALFGDAP